MNARDYLRDDFDMDTEDGGRNKSKGTTKPSATRRTYAKKRSKSPQQFNGIDKRRKKKIRW